jgi:hypothetical protein
MTIPSRGVDQHNQSGRPVIDMRSGEAVSLAGFDARNGGLRLRLQSALPTLVRQSPIKQSDLPVGLPPLNPVQPPSQKYSGFPKTQITPYRQPSRPT